MFALVDVNSFYASCEKNFRPDLKNAPVIVLSNNDGCIIARSKEAKELGIKMGAPWFEVSKQRFPVKVHVFSSNYALYANMSNRVMTTLASVANKIEVYSIDESFLDITGINNCADYEEYGRYVRNTVKSVTGLTVGCGIGKTKTLAKSAQWGTKEWPAFGGVLAITDQQRAEKLLVRQPVEEIWGVGRKISTRLNAIGIKTALDLARANTSMIRRNFSVVLERTVRELNGESCILLEEVPPSKQQIVCSLSFGERVTEYHMLRQAICYHAERAAVKLRDEHQFCTQISAFIKTSPFTQGEKYYGNMASELLMTPSRDSRDIIDAAMRAFDKIWEPGHRYAKAGVMLSRFTPTGVSQMNLFDEHLPKPNSDKLMNVIDGINQSGLGNIWFAGRGIAPKWQMKRNMLSPAYTTRWSDLPVAKMI